MHANELFDKVTTDLITAIENGASGWRMPWHCLANGTPCSADGRPYRGWNALVLAMVAADRGWTAGTWATYKTWAKHGCQVRRGGERGTHIVLWKQTERPDPTDDDRTKRSLLARCSSRSLPNRSTAPTASPPPTSARLLNGSSRPTCTLRGLLAPTWSMADPEPPTPRPRHDPPAPPGPVRPDDGLLLNQRP